MIRFFSSTNLTRTLAAALVLGTMTAQGGWRQTAGRFSKTAFEVTCKGIGHGCAWGLAFSGAITLGNYNYSGTLHTCKSLNMQEASPIVTAFVQQEAQKNLPHNKKSLHMLTLDSGMQSPFLYAATAQDKEVQVILTNLRTKTLLYSGSEEGKNLLRAVLAHECSHLRHNDHFYGSVAAIASPGVVHYGCKFLGRKKSTSSGLIATLMRIPKGMGKGAAAWLLYAFYKRTLEQRADDDIPDDPVLLKAWSRKLREEHLLDIAAMSEESNCTLNDAEAINSMTHLFKQHPTSRKRAEKLSRRTQEIEQRKQGEDSQTIH